MYANTSNGKTVFTIDPTDDPEFNRLLDKVNELQKELNNAVHELMYYSHRFKLSCNFIMESQDE